MSNTSDTTMKIQRALGYVWVFFVFFPAACVLFVFPLAPDYFENMAIRANGLLDVIELGRSRPWVVFTGMPYPAVLRLAGDASGIFAILAILIMIRLVSVLAFTKNQKMGEERKTRQNKQYGGFTNKKWIKQIFMGFFLIVFGVFIIFRYYIFEYPIKVLNVAKLAFYVCLASGALSSFFMVITVYIMMGIWFIKRNSEPVL